MPAPLPVPLREQMSTKRIAVLLLSVGWLSVAGTGSAELAAPADPRTQMRLRLDLTQVPLSDLCWVVEKRTGIAHTVADETTGDLLASVVGEVTVAQLQQALASAMLRSDAPLLLANARLHVERSEEAFALSISVPDRPAVTRRLALQGPAWLVPRLRQEEEKRRATLRRAAALAEDAGPVP